ncbi:hypothetical protein [Flavobacterium sp. GCM10022190]|uniref:hypothetical protein n=1 Tax=Flavobacterium sp. GCM10022190 TaxID=3252639 RepID=UPI0036D42674
MHAQILSEKGLSELSELGVYSELVKVLSLEDLKFLSDIGVYFNPIFSPASQTNIGKTIEHGSKVITIDINSLRKFTQSESVSIILHEIGHAINPWTKNEEGEYAADDYAIKRGYAEYIISSLEKGKRYWPEEFDKQITQNRIDRIKELLKEAKQ